MDFEKRLEIERRVRADEQEMLGRLLRHDKATRMRILTGLMIAAESMPDEAVLEYQPPPIPPVVRGPVTRSGGQQAARELVTNGAGPGRRPGPAQTLEEFLAASDKAIARQHAARVASRGDEGPTYRIINVLRGAPNGKLTALEIMGALKELYPGHEHGYVHQVLSRSNKTNGPFMRDAEKDPETKLYMYSLRPSSSFVEQDMFSGIETGEEDDV